MSKKPGHAAIREAFNEVINVNELFTAEGLSSIVEVSKQKTNSFIHHLTKKGMCEVHSKAGRITTYMKLKNDVIYATSLPHTEEVESKVTSPHVCEDDIFFEELPEEFNLGINTDNADIGNKIVDLIVSLRHKVVSLSNQVTELQKFKNTTLSENNLLSTQLWESQKHVTRLQSQIVDMSKQTKIKKVTI